MSNNLNMQNSIAKLLDGVAVEWKPLEEVIKSLKTGLNPRNNFKLNTSDAMNFYITVREIQNGKIVFLDKTDKINNQALKLINNRSNLEAGDILFSGTGTVGKTAVIDEKPKNWNIKEGVYVIKPVQEIVVSKYLSHLFNSKYIVNEYSKKIVGSPVISLPMSELKKIQIPIPSISVQTEIVRILDTFTALTAELTAELTARKKQYNYYRDKLLTFKEDEVEWKALGEVGQLIRGNGLQKKDFTETGVPAIHYGQIYTYYGTFATETKSFVSSELAKKLKKAKYGDILLAGTSENIKDVMTPLGWLGGEIVFSGDMYAFRPNNAVNTKYLTYLLQTTHFQKFKEKYANGTKVIRIQSEKFLTYKIPVPPLKEQTRIVEILDKFDAITNSLTEGLPREIELRQKQYEYYRDLLLDFTKVEDK